MMRDNVQNGIHRIVAWGLACLLLCGLAGVRLGNHGGQDFGGNGAALRRGAGFL